MLLSLCSQERPNRESSLGKRKYPRKKSVGALAATAGRNTRIHRSYATGQLTASQNVGGLVGELEDAEIMQQLRGSEYPNEWVLDIEYRRISSESIETYPLFSA